MTHELEKLDTFLGVAAGTSKQVLISHADPAALNKKLLAFGITLDADGMVPKHQRGQWKSLMSRAGISKKYWKDPDLLLAEASVEDL